MDEDAVAKVRQAIKNVEDAIYGKGFDSVKALDLSIVLSLAKEFVSLLDRSAKEIENYLLYGEMEDAPSIEKKEGIVQ